MNAWFLLLFLIAPQEERQPQGLAGVGLKPEDVHRAIDRGVEFLRREYESRERMEPSGQHLVAALAILQAEGHKKHRDLDDKILAMLKATDPRVLGTYELGVIAMICEALGDPRWLPLLQNSVQLLLETQGEGGSWGYGGAVEAPSVKDEAKRARIRVIGGRPLDGSVPRGSALIRKTPWDAQWNGQDNSVSQYAVLGLYSGLRAGLGIDPEAWRRARNYYLEGQSEAGGWGYGPQDEPYGSMVCAGVASVAVSGYALGDSEWKKQESIQRGLRWLGENFTVDHNPKNENEYHYYYLYGLERVGRILDTEFIGDHEWYPLGAKYLVGAQREDGAWESDKDAYGDSTTLPTAFALLFLTRATPSPVAAPLKRGGKGTLVTTLTGTANFHVILDASGSMMAKIDGRPKFEIAKEAVCSIVESLPDGVKIGLRVYGHRKHGIDEGADEDTELLIPMAPLDRKAYVDRVRKLRCLGKTPLTLSLREGLKDLESLAKEPVTVILLTDGAESTPNADPTQAAQEMVQARRNAILHVIAFDISDPPSRKQMEGIAKAGNGRCFSASKAKELLEQLQRVFVTKTSYELTDKEGRKIADGLLGDRRELPEGLYRFRCAVGAENFDEEFWINTDATTTVTLDVSEDRPPEAKRDVPQAKKKGEVVLSIGGTEVRADELTFTYAPSAEEGEPGTLTFEGALTAVFSSRAVRGITLRLGEDAVLKWDEERLLTPKRASIKIEGWDKTVLSGTISGVFLSGEEEVKVTGTFRAVERKDD